MALTPQEVEVEFVANTKQLEKIAESLADLFLRFERDLRVFLKDIREQETV